MLTLGNAKDRELIKHEKLEGVNDVFLPLLDIGWELTTIFNSNFTLT